MSRISLRSVNFQDRFVRHIDFLGELTPVVNELDKSDSTFEMVPGLADSQFVSFRSVNFPTHFLRHQGFRLKLQESNPAPGAPHDRLFAEDATFIRRPGLAGPGDPSLASFASFNFQDRFIRHKDFHVFIESANDDLARNDSTFVIVGGDTATFDSGPVTSDLPLGGSVHLVMRRNGYFTVNTHVHDSGFSNIDYVLSAVLVTPSGIAFTFPHSGHVEGTSAGLPFGTPDRNDDFTGSGNDPMIAREFDGVFVGAKLLVRLDGKDKLIGGIEGMLGDLLSQAAQAIGKAAVAAVVPLAV